MSGRAQAPVTQAEFARLVNVSKQMVGKGIKQGRIPKEFLLVDGNGKTKIADVERAKRAWASSADHSKAPTYVRERARHVAANADPRAARAAGLQLERAAPPPGPAPAVDSPAPVDPSVPNEQRSLPEEQARLAFWKANQAALEYRERVGELVDAKVLQADLADCFTRVRTKLLGIPARARQQIPTLTTGDVGKLDGFVREALDELVLEFEQHDASPSEAA